MEEILQTIFGLLGGLALFIFGMNMMSDSLQKVAGEKMKKILSALTKNPILGVLAGALTTAVLQSSSATTVMAIGFVSAGLMRLPQAISVILGANIGTTMTAQLLAFKISDYIYIFVFLGFLIAFISRSEKIRYLGETIFAFGLLFVGIETMGGVMKPLASSPVFTDMIAKVADIPVLGVAVGTLMTLVVQSSSATIAVLQNFASQAGADGATSILGLEGAIPILLGDNIGTTITALLACIGQSKDAKRTAVAHCTFNISGCLIFIWLIHPFARFITWISPKGDEVEVISRQIANAHTAFNITMTILWLPFIWLLVKIVMRIVPDGKKSAIDPAMPKYLDHKLTSQPAAALHLVAKEVMHYGKVVEQLLKDIIHVSQTDDKKQLLKQVQMLYDTSSRAKNLHEQIVNYLAELFSGGVLTEEQATQTAGLMYVLGDIDRMNSLCEDMADSLKEKAESKKQFSQSAVLSLQTALKTIEEMYSGAIRIMEYGTDDQAESLLKNREIILDLDITMQKEHMNRVADGICDASLTAPFSQILHCIDRMGNSCVNIAEAVSGKVNFSYFSGLKEIEQEPVPEMY
ncbi:MAG: Na/Pi cotransporter family protein [Ruminococcus sp.]